MAERVRLPPGLGAAAAGAAAVPRAAQAAAAGSSAAPAARPSSPVAQLERLEQGDGVMLPPGYYCVERTAQNPRSSSTRAWKEYFATKTTKKPTKTKSYI